MLCREESRMTLDEAFAVVERAARPIAVLRTVRSIVAMLRREESRMTDPATKHHGPFTCGERVRPTPAWRDGITPEIPDGEVTHAEPFGLGQLIRVGDDPKLYPSGIFERDGGAAA